MTFELLPKHVHILERRSCLHKVAVPVHQELVDPDDLRAILDLSAAGLIKHIDTTILPYQNVYLRLDIYQLTDAGIELCMKHNIPYLDSTT